MICSLAMRFSLQMGLVLVMLKYDKMRKFWTPMVKCNRFLNRSTIGSTIYGSILSLNNYCGRQAICHENLHWGIVDGVGQSTLLINYPKKMEIK